MASLVHRPFAALCAAGPWWGLLVAGSCRPAREARGVPDGARPWRGSRPQHRLWGRGTHRFPTPARRRSTTGIRYRSATDSSTPPGHPPGGTPEPGCHFGHEQGGIPGDNNIYSTTGPIPLGYANQQLDIYAPTPRPTRTTLGTRSSGRTHPDECRGAPGTSSPSPATFLA